MSHPTWVRGLKQVKKSNAKRHRHVAPYVGAWIETHASDSIRSGRAVAPYVGAWIETTLKR